MLIDWFTVGAQLFNFALLVWLLKRYLYQPILDAIDAREQRIVKELAEADSIKKRALQARQKFETANAEFHQLRDSLLEKATQEAGVKRDEILQQARQAAQALVHKRNESLKSETEQKLQEIAKRVQHAVFSISRRALSDLASTELEACISTAFVARLRTIDAQVKQTFVNGFEKDTAQVRSAFELSAEQRDLIQNAVHTAIAPNAEVHFDVNPDLVSGIELSANGHTLSWSIDQYLSDMERGIRESLPITPVRTLEKQAS